MKKVVIGVIGTDCHTVGNKLIHNKLKLNGFEVINIGPLSPKDLGFDRVYRPGMSIDVTIEDLKKDLNMLEEE